MAHIGQKKTLGPVSRIGPLAGFRQRALTVADAIHHAVEILRQRAQLIIARHTQAQIQIAALSNTLNRVMQLGQSLEHRPAHIDMHQRHRQQRHQQQTQPRQRQHTGAMPIAITAHVDAAEHHRIVLIVTDDELTDHGAVIQTNYPGTTLKITAEWLQLHRQAGDTAQLIGHHRIQRHGKEHCATITYLLQRKQMRNPGNTGYTPERVAKTFLILAIQPLKRRRISALMV